MAAFAENSDFEGVNSCQCRTTTRSHNASLNGVNMLTKGYGSEWEPFHINHRLSLLSRRARSPQLVGRGRSGCRSSGSLPRAVTLQWPSRRYYACNAHKHASPAESTVISYISFRMYKLHVFLQEKCEVLINIKKFVSKNITTTSKMNGKVTIKLK